MLFFFPSFLCLWFANSPNVDDDSHSHCLASITILFLTEATWNVRSCGEKNDQKIDFRVRYFIAFCTDELQVFIFLYRYRMCIALLWFYSKSP